MPDDQMEGVRGRSEPLLLERLTWPQVERLIRDGERLCVQPVGATEQHGRHLPLSTDTVIATEICHEASRRTAVPILPALAVTSSHAHTTRWPGTREGGLVQSRRYLGRLYRRTASERYCRR